MSSPAVQAPRTGALTALAVAMGLLAFSNFMKPVSQAFAPDSTAGFVFFGQRLHGVANAIVGPLFGALLAAYAYGVWTRQRWVVPIAVGYAGYVVANLLLFFVFGPAADNPGVLGSLVYSAVAIGVSGGGAWYLLQIRDRLR